MNLTSYQKKSLSGLLISLLLFAIILIAVTSAYAATPNAESYTISTSIEGTIAPEEIPAHSFRVIASVLNVRSGPGLDYPVIGQVYYDDIIWYNPELISTLEWMGMYKGTLQGFVSREYIVEI